MPPLQAPLAKMIEEPSRSRNKERIAAFAVIGVYYRRLKQAEKLDRHLADHKTEFGNTTFFKHLKLNHFSMTASRQRNAEEVYRYGHALCENSRKQADREPNPGILHAFSLAIVETLEGNATLLSPDKSLDKREKNYRHGKPLSQNGYSLCHHIPPKPYCLDGQLRHKKQYQRADRYKIM